MEFGRSDSGRTAVAGNDTKHSSIDPTAHKNRTLNTVPTQTRIQKIVAGRKVGRKLKAYRKRFVVRTGLYPLAQGLCVSAKYGRALSSFKHHCVNGLLNTLMKAHTITPE